MNVTLFSKPDCKQCDFTKREFDKHGIDYVIVDVTADDAGRQKCIDLGYSSMPVVLVEAGQEIAHWSGLPDGRDQGSRLPGGGAAVTSHLDPHVDPFSEECLPAEPDPFHEYDPRDDVKEWQR